MTPLPTFFPVSPTFHINLNQITNIWLDSNVIHLQLSCGEEVILRDAKVIQQFCDLTNFPYHHETQIPQP